MRAALLYTVLRLAAFAATAAILLALVALTGWDVPVVAVLAAAALLSGLISLRLLARQRSAMAASVADVAQRARTSVDTAASSEDEQIQASSRPTDSSSA